MTIHTKWMELLRKEATDAFQYGTLTEAVNASFIDGQIKLMISVDPSQSWADFIHSKFTSVIMRHFMEYGCSTVILAFDDKRFVPKAKVITQLKRRAGVNIIPFDQSDVLPNHLPLEWRESIMNPWFKHRVLELICANIPRLISPPKGSKLIVDWETVTEYTYGDEDQPSVSEIGQQDPVGEADLKFTRWMQALGCPMLIEATDGDYIPISFGLNVAGFEQPVTILKAWNQQRGFEFISIQKLLSFVQNKFRDSLHKQKSPECPWWEVKLFITLLGLSGTDFTRNLPLVSPQKMWSALPLITRTFAMETSCRIHELQGKRIVELLYAEAFPKHIDVFSRQSIWIQAQASKLGQRNKELIPTDARIMCTLRNINFLLSYWLEFRAPSNIESYGFRCHAEGRVEWDD